MAFMSAGSAEIVPSQDPELPRTLRSAPACKDTTPNNSESDRMRLNSKICVIDTGRGGIWLELTREQYRKLHFPQVLRSNYP